MRLFVASAISSNDLKQILSYQPPAHNDARLSGPKLLHMTLQFIGEENPAKVDQALRSVRFPQFETNLSHTDIFSPRKSKHILWLGVKLTKDLKSLHHQITHNLIEHNIKIDTRSYSPHITLARCNKSIDSRYIQSFLDQDVRETPYKISQFHLYQSHRVNDQLRYDILQSYDSC